MIDEDVRNGLILDMPVFGNAKDYSNNNNDGTVTNATLTTDRFGRANRAYDFANTGQIDFGNKAIFDFGVNDFAISVWVYPRTFTGLTTNVVGKCNSGAVANGYLLSVLADGKPRMRVSSGSSVKTITSVNAITLNTWNHLVCLRHNNYLYLYVNGVQAATPTALSSDYSIDSVAYNLLMGAALSYTSSDAIYTELRMYNKGLDLNEVLKLYRK